MTEEQIKTRWAAILKHLDKIDGLDAGDRMRIPLGFPFNFVGNRIGVAYCPVIVQDDQRIPEPMEIDPMCVFTEWMLKYAVAHSDKPLCSYDVLEFLVTEHAADGLPALGVDMDCFNVQLLDRSAGNRIDNETLEARKRELEKRMNSTRISRWMIGIDLAEGRDFTPTED